MVDPDRPQMTIIRRMRTPRATDTLRICNICCFSTATMGTRLSNMLIRTVHYLACLYISYSV
jgi:hypothetical protein